MTALAEAYSWITGRTLAAFLVRGAAGIGLIVAGFLLAGERPLVGLTLAILGLVPLGGCPTCWLGGAIGAACEWRAPKQPPRTTARQDRD
jgi:predicted PurR-regulated permease PerM